MNKKIIINLEVICILFFFLDIWKKKKNLAVEKFDVNLFL